MNDDKATILEFNPEAFLKEFETKIIQGYRLDSVSYSFPIGVFEVQMKRLTPWVRKKPSTEGVPDKGPYTVKQMKAMGLTELRKRTTEEYNITDRGLNRLISKVLKHYEEEKCKKKS